MAFTFESLGFGAIDSGVILTEQVARNPFHVLGRRVHLPQQGTVVTSFGSIEAQGVGEGEEKLASGASASTPVGANKIQATIIETEEYFAATEEAAFTLVQDQLPSAIAKQSTAITAGIVAAPTLWSNYGTFKLTDELEIGEGADAAVDFDDALAALASGEYNGVVLSTAMLNYLKRQRLANGTRVFEIDGNTTSGTIEGIRYETFVSSEQVGIVGNWDDYVWGVSEFPNPVDGEYVRVYTSGSQDDTNGVTHNLNAENKIAIRYEQLVGSGIANADSFVKIVPAAVEEG